MLKQKALFFLRRYNDIDHIVPVLYKWLSLKDIPTEVMITTDRNHLHDYRIQFLRQFDNLRIRFQRLNPDRDKWQSCFRQYKSSMLGC